MYAIIDLETTGGSASNDRITEIAIILHDGQRRIGEFTTLVNPERSIPGYITEITGISDAMVAKAPRFYEVAKEVVEFTQDCIFVAHNVNFDYSFLREEFKRLAYTYEREKICTVRMSRALIPGLPSYSLGRLCQSLGIAIRDRHRAKGDADATVLVLERLIQLQPSLATTRKTTRDPFAGIPSGISRKNLSMLPEEPGLYFFHDSGGQVLHVMACSNIRQAAMKELNTNGKGQAKEAFDFQRICEVTWELTGNELIALLRLENEKTRIGSETVQTKARSSSKFGVFAYQDQRGYLRVFVDKIQKGKVGYGEFHTEADARAALEARIRKFELCPQLGGMEQGTGACSWYDDKNKNCGGACRGGESASEYNHRLESALQGLGFPHPAFFLLCEGRNQDEITVIAVEKGHLLGFAYLDADQGWEDPSGVKSLLQPLQASEAANATLKLYLSKHRMSKLVPY